MSLEIITVIAILWTLLGIVAMMILNDSVKRNQVVFYKRFIMCLCCGPAIWVVAGVPATYGALVRWLKR